MIDYVVNHVSYCILNFTALKDDISMVYNEIVLDSRNYRRKFGTFWCILSSLIFSLQNLVCNHEYFLLERG